MFTEPLPSFATNTHALYILRLYLRLPVDRKYQKRQSMDDFIISLCYSKYKRRWIIVIFLQEKHKNNNTPSTFIF